MRHKLGIFIVMAIVLVILLPVAVLLMINAGWNSQGTPTEIKGGFSAELLNALDTKYEITIPDDAIFVKGINTNAMRDPSVPDTYNFLKSLEARLPDVEDFC